VSVSVSVSVSESLLRFNRRFWARFGIGGVVDLLPEKQIVMCGQKWQATGGGGGGGGSCVLRYH